MKVAPLLLAAAFACGAAQAQVERWDFVVRLDGRPIGTHRFVVSGPPAAREVESTAQFDVKLLGIPVYRYRHEARERWRGDCLLELRARTDDNGQPVQVDQRRDDCVMGYAYWHPALRQQKLLLNPQTGATDTVRVEPLPDASLTGGTSDPRAARWQISTPKQEIVLWLDRVSGRWIGLDAQLSGGRLLTYRLP